MDPVAEAELVVGEGLVGNADQRRRTQVTVISAERWARAEAELGVTLDPSLRRANLLVSGVDLVGSRGRTLAVGGARLRLGRQCAPCRVMDEQHPGLQAALRDDGGGGVYATVVQGGPIAEGDEVTLT